MTGSTALLLLTLSRGLSGEPSDAAPPALSLHGEAAQPSPWSMDLTLRGGPFMAQPTRASSADQPARPTVGASAQVAPLAVAQPAPPAQATAAQASAEPPPEQCDVECEDARAGQRAARYVMRNRESTLRTHRAFAIAAWSTMLVTEALGTIQMINQDTWFGRGNCASDPRAFACQQYSLVQSLHETFAFVTTGLYTTAGVLAVAAPDPENASVGQGGAESRLRLHKTLAYIHGAGMIILPILGILSIHPEIFGINDNDARADFTRATRTVHSILGYATFATFTAAGILEF